MAELKVDATLRAAVDLARTALDGVAEPLSVGDHLEMVMDAERVATHRSEERRVGKECTATCRSRWSPYH